MTTFTEVSHDGEFLLSEAPGTLSREKVTILSGEDLEAGAVIAKITASGKYVAWDPAASAESDGSTTVAGVLLNKVDASAGDVDGTAIVRFAEVNTNLLVWPTAAQQSEKTAALAVLLATPYFIRAR